jgi:CRP/FNR family transcriptional regulator, transcriptional activator FtrB
MTEQTWRQVAAATPFSAVHDERVLKDLKHAMQVRKLSRGDVLVRQGDEPRFVFLILSGVVQLSTDHNRRRAVCDVASGPLFVSLDAALSGGPSLHTAITLSRQGEACSFPINLFTTVCAQDTKFTFAVAQLVASQYRKAARTLASEKLRTANERVASWILQRHREQQGCPITIQTSKRVLASQLGTSPENLSRALVLLSSHGVRCQGQDVYVHDPSALEKIAKPNILLDRF